MAHFIAEIPALGAETNPKTLKAMRDEPNIVGVVFFFFLFSKRSSQKKVKNSEDLCHDLHTCANCACTCIRFSLQKKSLSWGNETIQQSKQRRKRRVA